MHTRHLSLCFANFQAVVHQVEPRVQVVDLHAASLRPLGIDGQDHVCVRQFQPFNEKLLLREFAVVQVQVQPVNLHQHVLAPLVVEHPHIPGYQPVDRVKTEPAELNVEAPLLHLRHHKAPPAPAKIVREQIAHAARQQKQQGFEKEAWKKAAHETW